MPFITGGPRNIYDALRSQAQHLVNWCAPHLCQVCGNISGGEPVCHECAAQLMPNDCACPGCGWPGQNAVCRLCRQRQPGFDLAQAAFVYQFPLDKLVQAFKYRQRLALVEYFARRLLCLPVVAEGGYDVIVPMPLHKARLRQRGFNQAVLLARSVARQQCKPLLLDGVLRLRNTPRQEGLSRRLRRANMRHVFQCTVRLDGQSVLVVDDVMTSGASAEALARALKMAGAAQVKIVVLARTPLRLRY